MQFQLRKFDLIIIGLVALLAVAIVSTVIFKTNIAKTPVTDEKNIVFQVYFRGVTITGTEAPFTPGGETFMTIRNVPYKKIPIAFNETIRRNIVYLNSKDAPQSVEDVSLPFLYDFIVTLTDIAKITDDGPVLGGNKIKVGVPIVLEGEDYRLQGVVSLVKILTTEEALKVEDDMAKLRLKAREDLQKIKAKQLQAQQVKK